MSRLALLALALLAGSLAAGADAPAEPPPFRLTLGPSARWLTPDVLVVPYELRNATDAPRVVAQVPGLTLVTTCATSGGGARGGVPGGSWCGLGEPARKLFLTLQPGEALLGEEAVIVPADCVADIAVLGAFQWEGGESIGLQVRRGSTTSPPLPITTPRPAWAATR